MVLGVSTDSQASHAAFKQKYGLPFTLVSDEDHRIVTAYDVWKPKTTADGQTVMGIERTTFIIDEGGTITHVFARVQVDGHVDALLAALAEPAHAR